MCRRRNRIQIVALLSFLVIAVLIWGTVRFWPRKINVIVNPKLPVVFFHGGEIGIALPTEVLVAQVGAYPDTVAAFLQFDWIRGQETVVHPDRLMLCAPAAPRNGGRRIYLHLQNNILVDLPYLGNLLSDAVVPGFALETWTGKELSRCQQESSEFQEEFAKPPPLLLTDIPDSQLIKPMADFLAFKSVTDPRVRAQQLSGPVILSSNQAAELAEDIIVVARFYSLPLNYFLGIGAMENNFMSVRGDLDRAVWKNRPQHGDTIIRRKHGKVLVRNYSRGVWQITRETLRYAQMLYLRDQETRDYSLLPERLRPEAFKDPDEVRTKTLTTFAGLLFRTLLDHFDGNLMQAVGAYNGGRGKPNLSYAASVSVAAVYARRVIVHSVIADSKQSNAGRRYPDAEPVAIVVQGRFSRKPASLPNHLVIRSPLAEFGKVQ